MNQSASQWVGTRLSIMMFLQYLIWGAWYVSAYLYLGDIGFGGNEIKWTYSVGPIAGILSPFFVGMIADRFFSTEKVLAVLHFLAGLAMYASTMAMSSERPSPAVINLLFFAHMLCYFPTLALTNSIAFHNMRNPEREFPIVRVFGTLGWIVAGLFISWRAWDAGIEPFYFAAGAAILMGGYCLTLPHTPPPSVGKAVSSRELLGLDALVLFKNRAFLTFMICSFLICIPLSFYYQMATKFITQAGIEAPTAKMGLGQWSETIFMVVMPWFFARLGVKWMLFVGMLAWVLRYALFAIGAPGGVVWMLITGIVLHGICYDFFFVTGQLYVDKMAPRKIRSQAQGLLVLITLGLGMLIGAQVAGSIEVAFTTGEGNAAVVDWQQVWMLPAIFAGTVMILFTFLFRPREDSAGTEGAEPATATAS